MTFRCRGRKRAGWWFAECTRLLERVVALGSTHAYDRTVSFDPAIMDDDAQLNLAVCNVRMRTLKAAKGIFESRLASRTRGRQAGDNLKALASLGRK